MPDADRNLGLIGSLRAALAALLELASTRLELVAVEVEEQWEAAIGVLLWGMAAVFFASFALLLAALTIIIAFWEGHRLLVAILVTLSFAGAALGALLAVNARLRRRPRFLASTIAELKQDKAAVGQAPP